jgi:hypothetical protein
VCPPQPGEGTCSYGEQCSYGTGCNAVYCGCDSAGNWSCASTSCPPPECPPGAPSEGEACDYEGQSCDYGSNGGGCGLSCVCQSGGIDGGAPLVWTCYAPPCPPPACPPDPPQPGTACVSGTSCGYANDGGCGGEDCYCDPSGTWSCVFSGCIDAGPPFDAGSPGSD